MSETGSTLTLPKQVPHLHVNPATMYQPSGVTRDKDVVHSHSHFEWFRDRLKAQVFAPDTLSRHGASTVPFGPLNSSLT